MSDDRTIKNHHVVTTTHELRIDGHHLIEKKQRTMDQYMYCNNRYFGRHPKYR